VVTRATAVVELLERGEAARVTDLLSERVRAYVADGDWSVEAHLRDVWLPELEKLAGSPRSIATAREVSELIARFAIEGGRGRAFVTIRFDERHELDGLAIRTDDVDGIANIVIACPRTRRAEVAAFYEKLVRGARLVFGEARDDYRAPRWPDPEYPQQRHLDILVGDLEGAGDVALAAGAALLQDRGHYRSYADPIGHPFCLYADESRQGDEQPTPGVIGRIVIDCFSPRALAVFYEALLSMPTRVEDSAERVVIARDDGSLPMLAFQHAPMSCRLAGPTPRTRSRSTSTSASTTATPRSSLLNDSARSDCRAKAGAAPCMPTPQVTRSASACPASSRSAKSTHRAWTSASSGRCAEQRGDDVGGTVGDADLERDAAGIDGDREGEEGAAALLGRDESGELVEGDVVWELDAQRTIGCGAA
jgi:hypothetical protein